ncbi:MAG TPA: ATP-binding protein [Terriglobales bacterium]|nr:ATP-binding protein [Terriglobales bacterium]
MPQIRVHEKALAHLSRGLYRSPASAIRELVSNAWDARARTVRINTNYPNFLQISVQDDGDGFTKDEFVQLMQGGIGNSEKRSQGAKVIERPVIGRLGIGLLGVAQICPSFTIRSQTEEGEGFRARVVLYDLLKEKLDKDDDTVVKHDIIDIGTFELEKFQPEKGKKGTLIIGDDVHPTFTRAFRDSLSFEKFKKPPLDWAKALRIVSRVHSLQELGDYWRLLWELSACCPIPYISASSLPSGVVAADQRRLENYDFKVIVDGIQLAKPVALRSNPGGYTTKRIEAQKQKVYGVDLSFHGYIVVQEGLQLKPDELRGILIRVKDVAIGYYDQSMLDYRSNEGPRSRWLTGEIFVDSGLEDALNIDRDSFNRFHPEFRAIQEYVHELLKKDIFPRVYQQIDVRTAARHQSKSRVRRRELAKVLSKAVEKPVSLTYVSRSGSNDLQKVTVKNKAGKANVSLPDPEELETKRKNQQLASSILAIFEVSMREKGLERQRETFGKLLLDFLAHW